MIFKFLLVLILVFLVLFLGIFIVCSTFYLTAYLNEKGSKLFILTPLYLVIGIEVLCKLCDLALTFI